MTVNPCRLMVLASLALALACGKSEPKKKAGAPEKATTAAAKKEEAPAGPKLDAYWEDSSYVGIADQGPCPEGFWAFFGGDPPGETKEEQKANLAKKPELKKALEGKTFLVRMQGPNEVNLGEYNNSKGEFPVEVKASLLCKSPGIGNISIAFGPVKPQLPPGKDFGQYYWLGDPVPYGVPMKFGETAEFKSKHKLDFDARLVFTIGKVEQHKKVSRATETAEEKAERKKYNIPGGGGGMEDWGAGWVMHATVKGVRVAADRGRTELYTVRK